MPLPQNPGKRSFWKYLIDNQFVRIGKITGAHGLEGRVKVLVFSDVSGRFEPGNTLFLKIKSEFTEYTSTDYKEQPGRFSLLKLEGIDNREEALSLKGIEIFISRKAAEKTRKLLDKDDFYYYDLIGCSVYLDNELFGEVASIMQAGAGDILVLKSKDGRELFIPFIDSMVDTKNIFKGRIDIRPVDGLFDI